jgi:hypothetical protein
MSRREAGTAWWYRKVTLKLGVRDGLAEIETSFRFRKHCTAKRAEKKNCCKSDFKRRHG